MGSPKTSPTGLKSLASLEKELACWRTRDYWRIECDNPERTEALTIKNAIGEQTRKKAARTRPGVLARFVNEWLYSGTYQDGKTEYHTRTYQICDNARVTIDDRNEYAVKEYGITAENNDVETVLRGIRDYLEEQSFAEVIP
jgi:hypothetical protein